MRVRVFIDFWNFQLNWNERMLMDQCDWRVLPRAIVAEAALLLQPMGVVDPLVLEETLLYASVDPTTETPLKNWLTNMVDRMPSYRVQIRERQPQPKTIHCRECKAVFDRCSNCDAPYAPRPEKGVDTAIVTDLLSLAFQRSYDLAVLVSSDRDFIPAVEYLQSIGLKVINAGWSNRGHNLKRASWAAFDLERIAASVVRK